MCLPKTIIKDIQVKRHLLKTTYNEQLVIKQDIQHFETKIR